MSLKDKKETKESKSTEQSYKIVTRSKGTKPENKNDTSSNIHKEDTSKDAYPNDTKGSKKRKASVALDDVQNDDKPEKIKTTDKIQITVGQGSLKKILQRIIQNKYKTLNEDDNEFTSDEDDDLADDLDDDEDLMDDDDVVNADDDIDDVDEDDEYDEDDVKTLLNSGLSQKLQDKILRKNNRPIRAAAIAAKEAISTMVSLDTLENPNILPIQNVQHDEDIKRPLAATVAAIRKTRPPRKNQWSEELELIWKNESRKYKLSESKDKINVLTEEVVKLSNALEEDMPTLKKIMESDLDEDSKKSIIPLYVIYDSILEASFEKLLVQSKIIEKLKGMKLNSECIKTKKILAEINEHARSLEETILCLDVPVKEKAVIYKKYKNWEDMSAEDGGDEVKSKLKEWLDYAVRLPTKIKPLLQGRLSNDTHHDTKIISTCLQDIKNTLDNNLYGMIKEKEELLLIINNMLENPECKNLNLGFIGKAGVGKTALIRTLAKALDIPFIHISMGGCRDASFLDGHSYTYEGSQPGILVKSLCRMGSKNGIIYFDEIDKLSENSHSREVMWSLLHICDPTQNMEFRDKYLDELTIDLSNIWFMFSMNDEKKLDKILLDRLHLVHISNTTKVHKLQVIKKFTIPEALRNIAPSLIGQVTIPDETIQHLINARAEKYHEEDGMRGLIFDIQTILRRTSILKNTLDSNTLDLSFRIPNLTFPFVVTIPIMQKFLETANVENEDGYKSMFM